MSDTNNMLGDDDDDGRDNSDNPFTWVLIPLVALGIGAVIFTWLRYRRRRKLRILMLAAGRDVEGRHPHYYRPNGGYGGTAGVSGRRTRRLGLGAGLGSREEGLNELGEAPPAYTPAHKQRDSSQTDDVELRHLDHRRPTTNFGAGTDNVGAGTSTAGPPKYDEVQGDVGRGGNGFLPPTDEPAPLPRAVLSPT